MFWKALDRLFDTLLWKVLVVGLCVFLFVSLFQLLFVADLSINYAINSREQFPPSLRNFIHDAYGNGIFAVILLGILSLAGILDLIRDFYLSKQYRMLGDTIMSFADGNLAARFPLDSSKKIGKLGRAFNKMADSLQRLITELQDSESARKEIVANVAHDLAGPLTSIAGYVETVAKDFKQLDSVNSKAYLEIIRKNIQTLSKMIAALSDLSKLDNDQLPIQKEEFSLNTLLYDIVSRYALEVEKKNIKLRYDSQPISAVVCADMYMIERAVSNLIENAIRYTPPAGEIVISCSENQSQVCLQFSDSGIGIAEEDLPLIFERFYRVDKSRSRESGGSGLGLAIVKKIIDMHGGEIVISSAENQGTAVKLKLPKVDQTTSI